MLANGIFSILQDTRIRYLLAGGVNTAFGYAVGLGVYYSLSDHWHIVVLGILINVICITFSFCTYKMFVFRTKGKWLKEYLRCYVVYGSSALVGIASLWGLVDGLHIPFWLAQLFLLVLGIAISYLGHKKFTFSLK